jgi:hypothetical protein
MKSSRSAVVSVLAFLTPGLWGCGGSKTDAKDAAKAAGVTLEVRNIKVQHEDCPESGNKVVAYDSRNDGKPEVRRILDGKDRELCRITDLNQDGKPDLYEYYDDKGALRRRESSFVESGDITSIETFEGGKRTHREMDTSGQKRIDTWDTFDGASGKRVRRERDINGDGRVDQWWQWDGDKLTIAVDQNNDGYPDPEATVVVQGNNVGAPAEATAPGSATPAGSSSANAKAAPPAASASASSGNAAAPPAPPAPSASAAKGATPAPAASTAGKPATAAPPATPAPATAPTSSETGKAKP